MRADDGIRGLYVTGVQMCALPFWSASTSRTGGTLAGLTHFFARAAPQVRLVLADPVGSGLASLDRKSVVEGENGDPGRRRIMQTNPNEKRLNHLDNSVGSTQPFAV